jgi:hypothetical protein
MSRLLKSQSCRTVEPNGKLAGILEETKSLSRGKAQLPKAVTKITTLIAIMIAIKVAHGPTPRPKP